MPPLSYLTSPIHTKSNSHIVNSLATVISKPSLYRLLTIQVPNLMSFFHCLSCTKVAAQVQSMCSCFVAKPVFMVRSCQHFAQPQSWRTTPYWLTTAAYSIYLQLPSILKAVFPSTTWGRVMLWWQGTNYHGIRQPYLLNFTIFIQPSRAIVIIMKRSITSAEALQKCL